MTSAQSPSPAARPLMVETKFNPYSIAKAAVVSEMMDAGLSMDEACSTAGMSSSTYRYALLAGKAQPPQRAKIYPMRFHARSVARFQKMEELMAAGMYQSCAATAVGVSNESYSMWRLQDAANNNDVKLAGFAPVGRLVEGVRDFASEQRRASLAMDSIRDPGLRSTSKGAKVAHGDMTGRTTAINPNGLGANWKIEKFKGSETGLVAKAVLSYAAMKSLAAARAKGGQAHTDYVLGVITELSALGPNPLGDEWKLDKIEGDLDGITVTCSAVNDEKKLSEVISFLRNSHDSADSSSFYRTFSNAGLRMKARHS